jgi:hypothetical protein
LPGYAGRRSSREHPADSCSLNQFPGGFDRVGQKLGQTAAGTAAGDEDRRASDLTAPPPAGIHPLRRSAGTSEASRDEPPADLEWARALPVLQPRYCSAPGEDATGAGRRYRIRPLAIPRSGCRRGEHRDRTERSYSLRSSSTTKAGARPSGAGPAQKQHSWLGPAPSAARGMRRVPAASRPLDGRSGGAPR